MMASPTEMDTFKIMSNVDYVDWSRGVKQPDVTIEEIDSRPPSPLPPPSPPRIPSPPSPRSPGSRSISSSRTPSLPSSPRHPPSAPAPPKRAMPVPQKYSAKEENEDYEVRAEKEAILQDLLNLSRPPTNIKLTREFDVDLHTLDELQFEFDRIQSELNANQMVDYAKQGIKFGVGGLEMFLKNSGFAAVDGWYKNSCGDMSKYNRPLLKLYKRYWRKVSMSPTIELGMLLFGSLAWTVAENKMNLKPKPMPQAPPPPRAAEYDKPPPQMRPPSMSAKGPRWTSPPSPKSSRSSSPKSIVSEKKIVFPTPRSSRPKKSTPLRL